MHKCVVEVRMHILMHKYSVNISLCTNAVYTYPYAHMKAANDRWSRWPKSPLLPWLWLGLGRPAPTWNQDWSILLKVPYCKHILESGATVRPCARYDLALPKSLLSSIRFDKLSIFQKRFSASMVFSELSNLILSSLLPKDKDKLN